MTATFRAVLVCSAADPGSLQQTFVLLVSAMVFHLSNLSTDMETNTIQAGIQFLAWTGVMRYTYTVPYQLVCPAIENIV